MNMQAVPGRGRAARYTATALAAGIVLALGVFAPAAAQAAAPASAGGGAAYSPVDFSPQANFTWVAPETDPDGARGTYFPGGPVGSVTLGGIPFNIRSNAAGFQAWNGYEASGGGAGTVSITTPVNIYGATDVYTLINTYWGSSGPASYTALVFTGSGGARYTDHLVGNSNIRGWCCVGSINGTSTTNVYSVAQSPINGAQGFLDMQHIVLPPIFATQTLTSIKVVDSGATGVQRTVLDGVTVQSSPIITPGAIGQGARSFAVVISGSGWAVPPATAPKVTASGTGVTFSAVKAVSATTIDAKITVRSTAATGSRDLMVSQGANSATCTGCLTIDAHPTVTGINPSTLAQGATAHPETITGSGFVVGAGTKVTFAGPSKNVSGTVSSVGAATSFTAKVTVKPSATPGSYTLTVINPDGGRASLTNALTVTSG